MTKTTNASLEKKLVLRILHWGFLVTYSFQEDLSGAHSSIIRWMIPKVIDPNNINADIELLSNQLGQMAAAYQISGLPMTVVIPHQTAPLKTLDIPMNLNVASDKKEYASSIKAPYDFWKEFDDSLGDIKDAEIRASYLFANSTEGSSRMLYCATSSKTIKNYTTILLGGGFYPTAFVPEAQALIKIIESRLTRVEKEHSFCLFHLSKGNHKLIHCSNEEVNFSRVDISELDEILLEDLPAKEDLENAFWTDVSDRINTSLKQSVSQLKDERKVAAFETVFFVCDYDDEEALFKLFRKNFRLANFRLLSNVLDHIDTIMPDSGTQPKKESELKNSSLLLPNLGCYSLNPAITSIHNPVIDAPLFNMHPQSAFIENNFKRRPYFQLAVFSLMPIILFFGALDFYDTVISSKNRALESEFKRLDKELSAKKMAVQALEKNIQSTNKKFELLDKYLIGKNNDDVIGFVNNELPVSLELDRLVIREASLNVNGNSNSVSEINRFYEKLLAEPILTDININVYKRADSKLNYFEITARIRG